MLESAHPRAQKPSVERDSEVSSLLGTDGIKHRSRPLDAHTDSSSVPARAISISATSSDSPKSFLRRIVHSVRRRFSLHSALLGHRLKRRTRMQIVAFAILTLVMLMLLPFPILGVVQYFIEYVFYYMARAYGPYFRGSCLPQSRPGPGSLSIPTRSDLNIGILTGSVGREKCSFRQPVLERLQHYAQLQNYTLVDMSGYMTKLSAQHPNLSSNNWLKVLAVDHYVSQFDWVWYVDSDVWIADTGIRLEQLLAGVQNDTFMVLTFHNALEKSWLLRMIPSFISNRDKSNGDVQSGVFFLKNVSESHTLLQEWFDNRFKTKRDQKSLQTVFDRRLAQEKSAVTSESNDDSDAHHWPRGFQVLNQCAMNSAVFTNMNEQTYMDGDFVLHLYSKNCDEKRLIVDDLVHGRLVTRLQWDYLSEYDNFLFKCETCRHKDEPEKH